MGGFIVILIIVIAGLGGIFWIIKNDKETDSIFAVEKLEPEDILGVISPTQEPDESIMPPPPPEQILAGPALTEDGQVVSKVKSSPLTAITAKLGELTEKLKGLKIPKIPEINALKSKFGKKKIDDAVSTDSSGDKDQMAALRDQLHLTDNFSIPDEDNSEAPKDEGPLTGTASLKTSPSFEMPQIQGATDPFNEEPQIYAPAQPPAQSETSDKTNELREKYDKLQALFEEKSAELENTKKQIQNETQNRKEFEKIKSLLESELNNTKEKTRNIQVKLNSLNAENESYKTQIVHLEEKNSLLERNINVTDPEFEPLPSEAIPEENPYDPVVQELHVDDIPVIEATLEQVISHTHGPAAYQQDNSVQAENKPAAKPVVPDTPQEEKAEPPLEAPSLEASADVTPDINLDTQDTAEEAIKNPEIEESSLMPDNEVSVQMTSPETERSEPAAESLPEEMIEESPSEGDIPLPVASIEEEPIEVSTFPEAPEPLSERAFTKTTSPIAPQDETKEKPANPKMKIFEELAKPADHSSTDDSTPSKKASAGEKRSGDKTGTKISKEDIFESIENTSPSEQPEEPAEDPNYDESDDDNDEEETEFLSLPPDPFAEPKQNEENNF